MEDLREAAMELKAMTMKRKAAVLVASVALALAWAVPSWADTITFDPDGAPGGVAPVLIDLLDPAPGNGIVRGILGTSAPGTKGDFLFQANISVGKLGATVQFANNFAGANGFTVVVGISEILTSNSGGTLTFGFDPTGPTNFFRIYSRAGGTGDDLSGLCFVSDCGNTLVLAGTALNNGSFSSATVADFAHPVGPLDQFGGDNYLGTVSGTANGSFQVDFDNWTFINPAYFPAGLLSTIRFVGSSQLTDPYKDVNPSACFSSNGIITCTQPGVASVGTTNGLSGPNGMLQTDGSLSFQGPPPPPIPEPATLTLLGLGLFGSAAARRRQARKAK